MRTDLKRRKFMQLIGLSTAAAALPGCIPVKPKSLIPYIIPQEEIIPGRSAWYASVCRECPAGCGISVRVREGRATKVEGNPLHPLNEGSLCARGQAALQGLYNPDRFRSPMRRTAKGTWEEIGWPQAEELFLASVHEVMRQNRGDGVVFLTPLLTGSLDALVDEWLSAIGSARRYRWEPFGYEPMMRANELLFGLREVPEYDFGSAEVVLSFGADFLETWISPLSQTKGFAAMRSALDWKRGRFVYFGPRLSMTAANADKWIDVHPDHLGAVALAMVNVILQEGSHARLGAEDERAIAAMAGRFTVDSVAALTGVSRTLITETARAFSRGPGLAVSGGPGTDGEYGVQNAAAVNLLNLVCGNIGRTVRFGSPHALSRVSTFASMEQLVRSMERGEVSMLLTHEVNPAYTLTSTGIRAAIRKIPHVVSFSSTVDETSSLASLILPVHTPLESWGDFEPYPGLHGLMQPAMQPVFPTRMLGDLLLETGRKVSSERRFPAASFHDYVQSRWRDLHHRLGRKESFESFWVESLARGGVWEDRESRTVPRLRSLSPSFIRWPSELPHGDSTFALLVYPPISAFDGRGANKPWLQELPDPMTRLAWGSWVEISPEDASRLDLKEGEALRISSPYAKGEFPIHISAGVRPGCLATPLGHGHAGYGRYASGVGSNAFALLDPKPSPDGSGGLLWSGTMVEVERADVKLPLATVQKESSEQGRDIARGMPLHRDGGKSSAKREEEPSLYPPREYQKHRWGMVVDLDRCTGCGACVTACYAENNIPVVGSDEVTNGRHMAWLRIDRYQSAPERGQPETMRVKFIPMLCQQCGDAPCETVCPVYAAYHTDEGINGQVYNRCIGTRYCANNCPYKVRRFNWFEHEWPEPLNWQLNPEVTVRSKGVMEKCTFCIQRIVEGKNNARMERREVQDGEIRTACEQSCPAQAITFGDLKNPDSRVARLSAPDNPRVYHVLEELNTRPSVAYLKRIHGLQTQLR